MDCPKCKFQNPEGIKFCGECGNKLEQICPECDSTNPPVFKFCGECGFRLQEQHQKSREINYSEPQSYTPKHLADKILINRSSIEGERKLVSVLFADVANYTAISENLDPEEMHQIMDGCFKILMDEIHKYEGTINQFTGDGVMALFGAPMAHEDHGQRACRAALSIQKTIKKYSGELKAKFDISFEMRIGINSGLVVVGSIGDDLRMDYTAVGDTTNLAARMENIAKAGSICISEKTQKLVRDFFELEFQGDIQIKGKEKPQKIYQLIKTGEIATRIDASIAKGLTRFVGRRESMTTLIQSFEKVKTGSGQILGIVGEPGVGKSRLLFEMRNKISKNEYRYLEGRCLQYGGSIIYLPILDILKSVFIINNDDKEFTVKRKINDIITSFGDEFKDMQTPFLEILSVKVDDESFIKLQPKEKREKIFEAIRNLLIRTSQDKPLIIAVEDLHWIDKTSEEFLKYFTDWLAKAQILLILLYRPEYNHLWGNKSYYTKIGINQLGINSSEDLIKSILAEGEVAPDLNQLILGRSAGNPLFMEEFTHALLENGSIEKKAHNYSLKRNLEDINIPDTVQGIISARLDRLEDNLKRTLQVASVIGRDFAFRILQTITGIRADLKSYLLNLQGLEFIYEKNLFPELEYIFKHALTQEVAYNSLLQKRRKEIHEKIGFAIEELYPEKLDEFLEMLAYHYCRSENIDKAKNYCKLAGQKAEKNYAHWDAFNFFNKAYVILDANSGTLENTKEKLEILLAMNLPLMVLGMPEESIWVIDKKIEIGNDLDDSDLVSQSYLEKANYYTLRGNNELGTEYAEQAYMEANKNQNIDLMVQSSFALGFASMPAGEFIKVISIVPKVLELIEENGREFDYFSLSTHPYSFLSASCGASFAHVGLFEKGIKVIKKAIASALKKKDLLNLAILESTYGYVYLSKGDWKKAMTHLQQGITYSIKINFSWFEAYGYCLTGYALAMLEQHDKAAEYAEKGIKLHENSGVEVFLSTTYVRAASIFKESGRLDLAKKYSKKSLAIAHKNNEKGAEGHANIVLGSLLYKTDPALKAESWNYLKKGKALLEKLQMKPYIAIGDLYQAEFYRDTLEKEKSIQSFKIAESMFQEMGMDSWLKKTRKLLSEL